MDKNRYFPQPRVGEIKEGLKTLKNNKAAGPDNIPAEGYLKSLNQYMVNIYSKASYRYMEGL